MRVSIAHTTRLEYSAPVADGVMDARLGPLSDPHQRWERFELRVRPAGALRSYTDGFGNLAYLITVPVSHEYIDVLTTSEVTTLLTDPFVPPEREPAPLTPAEQFDYLNPSRLVPAYAELDELAAPYRPAAPADSFEAAQRLMDLVHSRFTYTQQVTSVATTVPEVLRTRTGVCQDFAHVLIGLCRAVGIPARYVSGYLVLDPQTQRAEAAHAAREGGAPSSAASHAWVEAYTPTHGWRGFDPTNNLVASENYVKMALGRDYGDVPPTRGTFRGSADESLRVEVQTRVLD